MDGLVKDDGYAVNGNDDLMAAAVAARFLFLFLTHSRSVFYCRFRLGLCMPRSRIVSGFRSPVVGGVCRLMFCILMVIVCRFGRGFTVGIVIAVTGLRRFGSMTFGSMSLRRVTLIRMLLVTVLLLSVLGIGMVMRVLTLGTRFAS